MAPPRRSPRTAALRLVSVAPSGLEPGLRVFGRRTSWRRRGRRGRDRSSPGNAPSRAELLGHLMRDPGRPVAQDMHPRIVSSIRRRRTSSVAVPLRRRRSSVSSTPRARRFASTIVASVGRPGRRHRRALRLALRGGPAGPARVLVRPPATKRTPSCGNALGG
jgi:hypothetical protein